MKNYFKCYYFIFIGIFIIQIMCFAQNSYNYTAHSDFQKFWVDFKNAVNSVDKDAVLQMTNIPFEDRFQDIYNKSKSFTSNTNEIFLLNYDKIFIPVTLKAINSDSYRGWDKNAETDEDGPGFDVIGKDDYLLIVPRDGMGRDMDLAFTKINGLYKLSYIPYYE